MGALLFLLAKTSRTPGRTLGVRQDSSRERHRRSLEKTETKRGCFRLETSCFCYV